MLQWNIIDELLLCVWLHLPRNISKSSWRLLANKYLQPIPYYSDLLLPQFSILTCQYFHHIEFLPCTHPCMELQVHPHFDLQWGKYDCWLDSLSISELDLAKVSLYSLTILSLQKSFWVLEWNEKLLNQILPKVSILSKSLLQQAIIPLCKPLTMLCVVFNAPFHSECIFLIRSRIL